MFQDISDLKNYYDWDFCNKSGYRKFIFKIKHFKTEKQVHEDYKGEFRTCNKCKKNLPKNSYFFNYHKKDVLEYTCKKCKGLRSYKWGRTFNYQLNSKNMHYCNKCDRILPLNIFYFPTTIGVNNRTGFSSNCKECNGGKFGLTDINNYVDIFKVKHNYKICHSCNLELPDNSIYFFDKKNRKNGTCICKKCKGYEYGIFQNLNKKLQIKNNCRICYICFKIKDKSMFYKESIYCIDCEKQKRKEYNSKYETKLSKKLHAHHRRQKSMSLKSDLTNEDWEFSLKMFNHSCAYCGMSCDEHYKIYKNTINQEHIVPLSKGGSYSKGNIIPSCKHCNSSKSNMILEEYFRCKKNPKFTKERYDKIIQYIDLFKHDLN